MKPPNTLQKGAFFGVLAVCLILALTVMAIKAVDQPQQTRIARHLHLAESARTIAPDHAS